MKFGYLIVVAEHPDVDYMKIAYSLALSIKNTQPDGYNNVALVTYDKNLVENFKSPWVFDEIIEWKQETYWNGRSWMDQLSPWDETVCLDADMILTRDISHCIDYFIENCDLYIPKKSFTYRGDVVTSDYYRRTFTANQLPNLYSFFTFFKKHSNKITDFFNLNRCIIKYPNQFSNHFLNKFRPEIIGTDEAFALSAQILGIEDDISFDLDFPRVLHMKSMVQNWPWPSEKFTNHVAFYFNKQNQVKLGNYFFYDIIHYVEKDLITDEIIGLQENKLWNQK